MDKIISALEIGLQSITDLISEAPRCAHAELNARASIIRAAIASAAAPQVVADERTAFREWNWSVPIIDRTQWNAWQARAALVPAPVQESSDLAKSILAIPCGYTLDHASGNHYDHQGHLEGFASALKEAAKLVSAAPVQAQESDSDKCDVGCKNASDCWDSEQCTKTWPAPVQPVAVPDATIVLSGHQLRMALDLINPGGPDERDELDDQLLFGIRQHRDDDGKVSTDMCCWNGDTDGVLPLDGEYEAPAAPAAQGDSRAIARYAYLRADSQQYYVAFRDQFGAFRQIREKELDKAIDAAIAAKAAS